MFRVKQLAGPLIICGVFIAAVSCLPIFSAFELADDEGYELMKGFLLSKGYTLYSQIWSDQPPGLTLLLSSAFRIFGPQIWIARFIAAGFGVLFLVSFYLIVRQRSGNWPASIATFLLIASPYIFTMSLAVIQEVPTFALGMIAVLFVFKWVEDSRWGWLIGSAVAMGLATEIKLTAALLIPAVLVEIWFNGNLAKTEFKRRIIPPVLWICISFAVFVLLALTLAPGGINQNWQSQFGSHLGPASERQSDYAFPFSILIDHAECAIGALVGIALVFRERAIRRMLFPLTLLFTALAVHSLHKPWWFYYYLHVAIPAAWLSGIAIDRAVLSARKHLSSTRYSAGFSGFLKGIGLCAAVAIALTRSEGRLESGFKQVQQCPKVGDEPIVAEMKNYAARTKWVYAKREIFAFHAQLPVPPELAVVSLKRYWSGQISEEMIVGLCKRYKPEMMLVQTYSTNEPWGSFLTSEYEIKRNTSTMTLYVSKRLLQEPPK